MSEQKVEITNNSLTLGTLCLIFISFNTCMSLMTPETKNTIDERQLEQDKKQYTLDSLALIQARKQYTMDSLQYKQMADFAQEYKKLKNREIRTDSLMRIDTKEQTEVMKKQYELDLSKKNEYVNAMRRLSGGR
ncbi:MAG: hypothetical protein R8N24_04850 [Alphaproteobacteria bacterium]|nr:hypothetical protein [Alphaproteobacteria bacterium]